MKALFEMSGLQVLLRAVRFFGEDDGAALAGYMAYSALLALFPFLIFATSLSGLVIGDMGSEESLAFLFDVVPEHVAHTLEPVVTQVVNGGSGGILSISAFGAIWVASNGVEALRVGLERAYNVAERRAFWKNRLIAIGFTMMAVAAFSLLGLLVVLGPVIASFAEQVLEVSAQKLDLWTWVRFGCGGVVLLTFLAALHYALPNGRPSIALWPGIVFTALIWMALASVFSVYFAFVPSYTVTYGALGGVIATLLFFYVSSAIFIFGAEINAALGEQREERGDGPERSAPMF